MEQRVIDRTKCIGCGLCVSDCINQYILLITEENGNKYAAFKERGRCLECGHCNAICPNGAISGGKAIYEADDTDALLLLMSKKRTVRKYKKGSIIPSEVLEKILLAGQTAPTDRNRKSARIVLIKDKISYLYNKALDYLVAEVQKTGQINPLYVPTMNLASKREEVLWNAEYLVLFIGLPSSTIDASIASERMQLIAWRYGVGSAYRGDMKTAINNVDELRDVIGIKKNEEVLISFVMGLTNLKYNCPAIKENRKVLML